MPRDELAGLLHLIHESHLSAIKGDTLDARTIVVEAARLAAGLESSPLVISISKYLLNLHALFSGQGLLLADRLAWTASYIGPALLCPPVIDFSKEYSSHDGNFVSLEPFCDNDPGLEKFPNNQSVPFVDTTFDCWEDGNQVALSLTQDLLTNCSVVSSMISVSASSFAPRLLRLISPNAPSHRYHVKLYLNGRWRLVTIDSRIPQNNHGRIWHVLAIVNWPALIEKALLKILGEGYLFAGSNMAMDTFVMTGWIPEIVLIESEINATKVIEHALSLRSHGRSLVGVGTGTMSAQLRKDLGLASDHDYTIVDYDPRRRVATLRNPWSGQPDTFERAPLAFIKHLYINWNPQLFQHSDKLDCVCLGASPIDKSPQYAIANPDKIAQTVWLLLERHLPSPRDARIQLVVYHTNHGERVLAKGQYAAHESLATCNRTQLVKVSIPPMSAYTTAVFCSWKGCMSLSAYSNGDSPLRLARARPYFPVACPELKGEWIGESRGGKIKSPTFVDNPQYLLQVKGKPANVQVALFSHNNDIVAIHIVNDTGHTPFQLTNFDNAKEIGEGDYTPLASVRILQILPGKYRVLVATHEPNRGGRFRLQLNHDGELNAVKLVKVMPMIALFTREFAFTDLDHLDLSVATLGRRSPIIVRARCYDQSGALVHVKIRIEGGDELVVGLQSQYGDSATSTAPPQSPVSVVVQKTRPCSGIVTIGSDTELSIS